MTDERQGFTGERRYLSSFARVPVYWHGFWWPTAEHPFQASKTLDENEIKAIKLAPSPAEAKALGRRVTLRSDWDQVRVPVMRGIVAAKFTANDEIQGLLLATGDEELVEINTWHDQFWGSCVCSAHAGVVGRNELGRALMDLRGYLRGGA